MARQLEWSHRSDNDLAAIEAYYVMVASPAVAIAASTAIFEAARKLCDLPSDYRPGKQGTREFVMRKFPYTLIYRATAGRVRIVRILHQARKYFT